MLLLMKLHLERQQAATEAFQLMTLLISLKDKAEAEQEVLAVLFIPLMAK